MAQEKAAEHAVIKVKDDKDFEEKLKNNKDKFIVVDFSAEWCGPCRFLEPKLEAMAKKYGDAVFLNVDVDKCGKTSEKYEIKAMPTIKFLVGGEVKATVVGADPKKIEAKIEELTKK